MNALPNTTLRRLMKLPQIPTVWEGDCRSLEGLGDPETSEKTGQFILWVDGAEGMVRSMDIVALETGPEATVRALIKAMEQPQSPARPARPQKIVVSDREMQFFLRGVLQDLEITVDYVTELPIIDELFERLAEIRPSRQPQLPPQYADILIERAYELWADAPWELVADHQVISVELNQWDLGTLYGTVIGMLELDYGIIFYRSLDSLIRFRASALSQGSMGEIEQAFLGQDCLFLTFSSRKDDDDDDESLDMADLPLSEITPQFGSIHPFEGMRPTLYEEEAIALAVTLEAVHNFFSECHRKLHNNFPSLKKTYKITPPLDINLPEVIPQPISVKVITLPEVANQLLEMEEAEDLDDDEPTFSLKDDLIPPVSFYSVGMMPWDVFNRLKPVVKHHQLNSKLEEKGEGLPVLMLQTTRPKAKTIMERIEEAGGLEGIIFNLGEDPFTESLYDVAILKMNNQDMYIFRDFSAEDPVHLKARKNWDQRCKKTKGACCLVIATGFSGASRGNPQPKDMFAFLETRYISQDELGIGNLQIVLGMDW